MRAGVHQKPYMSLEVEVAGAALVGGTWASIRPRPASKCMVPTVSLCRFKSFGLLSYLLINGLLLDCPERIASYSAGITSFYTANFIVWLWFGRCTFK